MSTTFLATRNIIKTILNKQINNTIKTSFYIPITNQIQQQQQQQQRLFHNSSYNRGFEEFVEKKIGTTKITSGRAWTVPDLRRKSFDDLHKLWYVLYKERNLLLSERDKGRRNSRPLNMADENRYIKVKHSMASIKHVMGERQKVGNLIKEKKEKEELNKI